MGCELALILLTLSAISWNPCLSRPIRVNQRAIFRPVWGVTIDYYPDRYILARNYYSGYFC